MSWPSVELASLTTKIGSGATPTGGESSYQSDGVPLIRSMNIHDGVFRDEGLAYLNEAQAGALENVTLQKGDVLLNITGASVARSCRLPERYEGGRVNQHVAIIRPIPTKLLPEYLEHYLINPQTKVQLLRIAGAGATREAITKAAIERLAVPLPPLAEQKRIAAILDQADELRRKRQRAIDHLSQLSQAIFYEICGEDSSDNPAPPLTNFLDYIQIGPFGSLLHKSDYVEDGVPLINPMHIVGGRIVANSSFSVTPKKLKTLSRYQLKEGDIIMGRRGEMGRCAVVGREHVGYVCGTGSMVLKCNRAKVSPEFLADYIRSPRIVSALDNASSGVTMANLNQKSLSAIPARIPDISVQQKYATMKVALNDELDRMAQSLAQLARLFKSLQHRAFRGEL